MTMIGQLRLPRRGENGRNSKDCSEVNVKAEGHRRYLNLSTNVTPFATRFAHHSTKKRVKNALSGGQQDTAGAQRKQELKQRMAEGMEMVGEEVNVEEVTATTN